MPEVRYDHESRGKINEPEEGGYSIKYASWSEWYTEGSQARSYMMKVNKEKDAHEESLLIRA